MFIPKAWDGIAIKKMEVKSSLPTDDPSALDVTMQHIVSWGNGKIVIVDSLHQA
jgi:hypothetical protein